MACPLQQHTPRRTARINLLLGLTPRKNKLAARSDPQDAARSDPQEATGKARSIFRLAS